MNRQEITQEILRRSVVAETALLKDGSQSFLVYPCGLPSCSVEAHTLKDAIERLHDIVPKFVDAMQAVGELIPPAETALTLDLGDLSFYEARSLESAVSVVNEEPRPRVSTETRACAVPA